MMGIHDNNIIGIHHTEKTGGSSVSHVVEQVYDPAKILVWNARNGSFIRRSDHRKFFGRKLPLNLIKQSLSNAPWLDILYRVSFTLKDRHHQRCELYSWNTIPEGTRILQGHMPVRKLHQVVGNNMVTVIRDPFERVQSQFLHTRRSGGSVQWRFEVPYHQGMTFMQYASQEEVTNWQTKVHEGVPLGQFGIVCTTECIEQLPEMMFPGCGINIPNKNRTPPLHNASEILYTTREFTEWYRDQNTEDYALLEEARNMVLSHHC